MATFVSHSHLLHASLLYLSIFFCFSMGIFAFEGRKVAELTHHTVQVSNLLPSTTCKPSNNKVAKNSAALEVVHKHGPCSKLNQFNANYENLDDILLRDQARVDSIHSRVTKAVSAASGGNLKETKATKLPTSSGASLGTGDYIVTVGLGSPRKDLPLIFDTGSDLTWAKCKPELQTFDPTKSSSYSNISCNSPFCSAVTSATGTSPGCTSSTCVYGIQYGDGSYTVGFLAKEKLSIGSTDSFDNFYFGCGQRNEGLFGNAAGLLGLGKDKLSVVSQTATKYNQIFSYCIPTSGSTGFLSFGGASGSKSAKFVPLSKSSSNFYRLDLAGITVGGTKLLIPPSVFSTGGGTIIDSGTVITRLPAVAYDALKSAFQKAMSKYPTAPPQSILDTCYDFSKYERVTVPIIGLSFNGGNDIAIDKTGIFVANGIQQVCLAFAGNSDGSDPAILGNTQQKTFEVIYDVNGGKIGFASGGCS